MTATTAALPTSASSLSATTRLIGRALSNLAEVSPRTAGRAAFELWRRPLTRGPVRDDERAVHDAARVSSVPWRGRRVAAYEWGDGARPVLLVHGWRSRASRFAPVIERLLAEGYSAVSYDALGHGATRGSAGTILDHEAIIRTLADRHGPFAGVIAHSLGAPMAFHAIRQGVSAPRVVTINGVGDFGYLVDAFCAALDLGPEVNAHLRRTIERRLFDGDSSIWERFSVGDGPADNLLVIQEQHDRIVHRGQADVITAARGPQTRRLDTSGLGHTALMGEPQVLDAVMDFLEEGVRS